MPFASWYTMDGNIIWAVGMESSHLRLEEKCQFLVRQAITERS